MRERASVGGRGRTSTYLVVSTSKLPAQNNRGAPNNKPNTHTAAQEHSQAHQRATCGGGELVRRSASNRGRGRTNTYLVRSSTFPAKNYS